MTNLLPATQPDPVVRSAAGTGGTGDATRLPHWVAGSGVPGTAVYRRRLGTALGRAVRRTALALDVPWAAVLGAAHARVLATLSGDAVVDSLLCGHGPPVRSRVAVGDGTWAELVAAVAAGLPPADAPSSGGCAPTDVVLDLADGDHADRPESSGLAAGTTVRVGVRWHGDQVLLSLGYRTDAVDDGYARRLAGYYRAALAALVAGPGVPHADARLVSATEWRWQREALCGPRRPLPQRRLHELVQQQVRLHPDAVAVSCQGRDWSYAELNRRANRIAHALLADGLGTGEPVVVLLPRDLYWAAAVLGVLKAGGAYLPVDPTVPVARIAAMIGRAGARYALVDPGTAVGLPAGVHRLAPDQPTARDRDARGWDADPDRPVAADALAYVCFTSGSTGEPKGVMCEHAGMLNHVLAKIEDLGIGTGTVVAQVAPVSFGPSIWQLVAAWLVGGRTLIVEQEAVLDTCQFLDVVEDARVEVLQVVPSYLAAVLEEVRLQPRALPSLRVLSATGERLPRDLVARWFAAYPAVPLVNAYGLTETCDDTNHEVLRAAPPGDRIALGRVVRNAEVYLLDGKLAPVPLGAPGEIVFAGLCVARGYVNDPERTAAAFGTDPADPARRLYRSGDFGRWSADGRLEYLGRRDSQVKIRGHRVELGEIEAALLSFPGVRASAVLPPAAGRDALVGWYCADGDLAADAIRTHLQQVLPGYLVPGLLYQVERMPLTANGKIDRRELAAWSAAAGVTRTGAGAPTMVRRPH